MFFWKRPSRLFAFATPDRRGYANCGCLTQIRNGGLDNCEAWTRELTNQIHADERIPANMDAFGGEFDEMTEFERFKALQPFAEWQRRIDKELELNFAKNDWRN